MLSPFREIEPLHKRDWVVLLRPGEIIFDIGANIGFTVHRFFKLLGGNCKIWAFEPLPRNLKLLERNSKFLGEQVTIVRSAVGKSDGTALFRDNLRHGALSRLEELATPHPGKMWHEAKSIEVNMITIDSFVKAAGVHPTFIKLDVEGAGHWALEGAHTVLSRHKPIVNCSFHSIEERQGVARILKFHGYQGVSVGNNGDIRLCDPGDVINKSGYGNFVDPNDPRFTAGR
jgi:FkbM family methyltransferase